MPGPLAKPAAMRQRRNRAPSAAKLGQASAATERPLPPREDAAEWHPQAASLWTEAWRSPMAEEYLEADVPGLLVVIELTHQFWLKPNAKMAAELRSQRLAYGLDPKARRQLQWEVARAESVQKKPPTPAPRRTNDPRLRLVSGE